MGNKRVVLAGSVLVIFSFLSNEIAQAYERPPVRPIPAEIESSRYNLSVSKIKSASQEAEKLAYLNTSSVFGVSRTKGIITRYYLNSQNNLSSKRVGEVSLKNISPNSQILRIENSKFNKGFLYTAITTKPDAKKCSYLILVKQNYTKTGSMGPASRIFQSDCDRSGNDTWGGGIAFSEKLLYFSIGENRISYKTAKPFTDFYSKTQLKKMNTYFGKVISINLSNNNEIKKISVGHRNPTGLYFDSASSTLFASEFGPEGGDEINIISKGNDYGYPDTSFGRIYDELNPGVKTQYPLSYEKYTKFAIPLIAYVPSINPVQLFKLSKDSKFVDWRGNLFVGCLSGKILRIVLNEKKTGVTVILSEELEIGARVRDLTEISNSSLLASTDDGELVLLSIQK